MGKVFDVKISKILEFLTEIVVLRKQKLFLFGLTLSNYMEERWKV